MPLCYPDAIIIRSMLVLSMTLPVNTEVPLSNGLRERTEQPSKRDPLQQNSEQKQKAQDDQQYQPKPSVAPIR